MRSKPAYQANAIPYLMIRDASRAIEFYKTAFGAEERMRFPAPDNTIGHAEIRIEGAPVFLADEGDEPGLRSPQQLGGTPVGVCIYVDDVDALAARAEAAGVVVLHPLADQFYGERSVSVQDPFGHIWHFSTITHEIAADVMSVRMQLARALLR